MPRFRSAYPPEFRRQMVELVRSGRTPEELAREFEPTAQSIANWVKNGPPLAGHGATAVRDAIARTIVGLPEQLKRTLTWDQGSEMAEHARLKIDAGLDIYFCDPHSPWQRPTNENTNGLLRQYFPKGTDLSAHGVNEIAAVAAALNSRPRKTLDWKTPAEALDALLLQAEKQSVATTV